MFVVVFLMLGIATISADPLALSPGDVRIEQNREGGLDLHVRARAGIGSILITESTADPDGREHSYALRNPVWHPANGDELRKLDGVFLNAHEQSRFFLVSSSVGDHPDLGRAFRIFIPYIVEYGYPWTRSGEVYVGDRSWINIRTFTLPYADYEGTYLDNPFVIRVIQPSPRPETDDAPDTTVVPHMPLAVSAFASIAAETDGTAQMIDGDPDVMDAVRAVVRTLPETGLDLAFVIDTTGSMTGSLGYVQTELVPMLIADLARHEPLRVGLVFYRDYYDEYVVRHVPFQVDLAVVQRHVERARAAGGGDVPEAVHEALFTALTSLEWEQESRVAILIGDAPPHPHPRGRITGPMVYAEATRLGVEIHTVVLPHP